MRNIVIRLLFLLIATTMIASAQISIYSSRPGRTYTISTTAKQYTFASNFGKRWLYQPAVIKLY